MAEPGDIAAIVAAGAAGYIPDGMRRAYEAHLEQGGGLGLVRTIPIWAASSALDPATFRKQLVGPAMGAEAAGSLQAMARLAAAPGSPGDVRAASGHLAAALKAGGENWLYNLTYAKDMAIYAAANAKEAGASATMAAGAAAGSVAVAGAAAGGVAVAGAATSPGPLVVVGRAAVTALAVPGAALAAGATILFWPSTVADATVTGRGLAPGGGTVMEARTPKPSGLPEPARPGGG